MGDHMKAMQGGMGMMKGMSGISAKGEMGGNEGEMKGTGERMPMAAMGELCDATDATGKAADMGGRGKMLAQRMDMMQMMMEKMMDRMPPTPALK